jgi:hypothetical protein
MKIYVMKLPADKKRYDELKKIYCKGKNKNAVNISMKGKKSEN